MHAISCQARALGRENEGQDQGNPVEISETGVHARVQAADVICVTCAGAGDPRLSAFRFRKVLLVNHFPPLRVAISTKHISVALYLVANVAFPLYAVAVNFKQRVL